MEDLGFHQRLMQTLEARGELNRAVEFLPDDMESPSRARAGVTRRSWPCCWPMPSSRFTPSCSIRRAGRSISGPRARALFPKALSERFGERSRSIGCGGDHCTQLANSIINRGGPSLVVRIADQTGAAAAGIATAFAAVRDSYGMTALKDAIGELDAKVPGKVQLRLYAAIEDLLRDRLVWFLRNVDMSNGLAGVVEHHRNGIATLSQALNSALPPEAAMARTARGAELQGAGVPEALARLIADLPELAAAPDIVLVADRTKKPVAEVAATYFAVQAFFRLERIVSAARAIPVSDYFDRLALDRAVDSIGEAERRLTAAMSETNVSGAAAVEAWIAPRKAEVERIRAAIHTIAGSGLTLSKLAVAASLLSDLAKIN